VVACTLRGGPLNGDQHELPLYMCIEKIGFQGKSWFTRDASGGVALVVGESPSGDPRWLNYTVHVYEKIGKVSRNVVDYRFLYSEEVTRCTATTKQGRLCRNQSEPLSDLCRTHLKASKPAK
jgi:hypothetical protein